MSKSPPMTTWVISGALTCVCIAIVFNLPLKDPFYPSNNTYLEFKKRLANFENSYQEDTTQSTVLCWGTSLTGQAVNHSAILRKQIKENTGQNIGLYKMYMHDGRPSFLPYMDELFELNEKISPQLIIIEDNLILYNRAAGILQAYYKTYRKHFDDLIHKKQELSLPRKLYDVKFDEFHPILLKQVISDTTQELEIKKRHIASFKANSMLSEKLSFIKENQIPIVILNVPRTGAIEKSFDQHSDTTRIHQYVVGMNNAGFNVRYWKHPKYLPYSYYSDLSHMNEKGMLYYSKWLTDKIAKEFSKKQSTDETVTTND